MNARAITLLCVGLYCVIYAAQANPYEDAAKRNDYVAMLRILQPLAREGNADAQAKLGVAYEKGYGVPISTDEAVGWYRRSANQGDAMGQLSLGLAYMRGEGVPRDLIEAYKWLTLSLIEPVVSEDAKRLAVGMKDVLATGGMLDKDQLAEAVRRARDWRPIREQKSVGSKIK